MICVTFMTIKVKDKDNLLFLIEQEHWNTPIKKLIDYNYE